MKLLTFLNNFKRQYNKHFDFRFFQESSSLRPLLSRLRDFKFFSKNPENIRSSTTPVVISFPRLNEINIDSADPGSKFANGAKNGGEN
jgi:hypothetical protein